MSDRKPVIIAVAVGGLALAANGAAAVIAISATSPPEAAAFGITGLIAAFIGLLTTILWAWRDEAPPQRRRERVFTPWTPLQEQDEAPLVAEEIEAVAPRALAAAAPVAAVSDGRVIYLQDWLKAHSAQHANA
jgi:hypothetical protein